MSKPKATAPAATPSATLAPDIFAQAVAFVLGPRIEGGYVNDPRDPGGETKFGISKRSYPKVNIKSLTRDDAIAIYKRDFWDATGCNDLPPKVAVVMFDTAINQGPAIAARLLQNALGNSVATDGIIGPKTIGAANKAHEAGNEDDLVIQFIGWRLRRYAFTANASNYMRGWANRVLELQHFLLTELVVV